MEIEKSISKDIWDAIRDNYEKGSYTSAITNLLQYLNEVVREKSGLSLDNTQLMDAAFLGKIPKLKINKFQTQTEKDIQSGIGYLLKGLCLAIRNPRAHERYNDDKKTADTVILFANYVLEFIRDSKQPTLVEDWISFIFDKNFNETKEYAQIVLNEIPEKKRYDILINIFRNRNKAKKNLLNNLINELMKNIKPDELQEFIDNLNKELLSCDDDNNLRMFLSMFPPEQWNCLVPLTKLKIENMIRKSLNEAKMETVFNGDYDEEPEYKCNNEGSLSTWAVSFIPYFDMKENIYSILGQKLASEDIDTRNFAIKFYSTVIFGDEYTKNASLIFGIKKSLTYLDKETYENIDFLCYFLGNQDAAKIYQKELDIAKRHFESTKENEQTGCDVASENELPF